MGLYWQNSSKWLGDFLESQGVIQILEFCKAYSETTHCLLCFVSGDLASAVFAFSDRGFASTGDLKKCL